MIIGVVDGGGMRRSTTNQTTIYVTKGLLKRGGVNYAELSYYGAFPP